MAELPGAVTDLSRIRDETVRIGEGGTIDAYLARPAEPGAYPGIIVIHEAFGMVEHIRDLARRFANIGYNAIAPDLYSRVGSPDPSDMGSVFPKMFGLSDAQVVTDLDAAAACLRALPQATGKIGCIGFCSGGRQTLLIACNSRAVDAAIDCWGGFTDRATPDAMTTPARPKPVLDLIESCACPVFAAFGVEDENPSPELAEETRRRASASGKDVTVKIYPDAGHAFLADYRPSYREAPAKQLWADLTAFFQTHLRP